MDVASPLANAPIVRDVHCVICTIHWGYFKRILSNLGDIWRKDCKATAAHSPPMMRPYSCCASEPIAMFSDNCPRNFSALVSCRCAADYLRSWPIRYELSSRARLGAVFKPGFSTRIVDFLALFVRSFVKSDPSFEPRKPGIRLGSARAAPLVSCSTHSRFCWYNVQPAEWCAHNYGTHFRPTRVSNKFHVILMFYLEARGFLWRFKCLGAGVPRPAWQKKLCVGKMLKDFILQVLQFFLQVCSRSANFMRH